MSALAGEVARLNKSLARMHENSHGGVAVEAPYRIHGYGTDDGHGLGGPPFDDSFVAYIGQLCFCGRHRNEDDPDDRGCSSISQRVFRPSDRHGHPQRLKRAFRKLRAIAPAEFDAIYLMAALGFSWHEARERINAERRTRGQREHSEGEFMVLTIAGTAKLVDLF